MSDPPPDGIVESRSWRSEKVVEELLPTPREPPADAFFLALSNSAFKSVTDA
jgi:hypothetical protein